MKELPWEVERPEGAVTVVLIRHGRTAWNAERRFLGTTDLSLDAVGREQARALGRWLRSPFEALYTSPLRRAVETAACLGGPAVQVPELRELHQGELEGLQVHEAVERYPSFFEDFARDPTGVQVPGGESLGACRDRAREALERAVAEHSPGSVIGLVTHQMVIASLLCTMRGEPLARWRDHGVRNLALSIADRTPGGWSPRLENWRFDDSDGPESPDV